MVGRRRLSPSLFLYLAGAYALIAALNVAIDIDKGWNGFRIPVVAALSALVLVTLGRWRRAVREQRER